MSHHTQNNEAPVLASHKPNRKNLLIGIAALLVVISSVVLLNISNTRIQGVGTYRNWSEDAIIQGGAITEKEMLQKYDQNASGVQSIFKHYGISRSDLTGQTSDIKHGIVYQDGRVVVDGKTVATNAYSVARKQFYDNRGNAPRKISVNGTTLYEGPNMSIFVRSVDAYVYFRNGAFYRAVISSCANPVMATATAQPKPVAPKPTPPAPKPAPTPVYSCNSLKATKINRTRYTFEAAAAAKDGAKIVDYTYEFGDGTKETITGTTIEHEYAKPGKYTAKVTVNVGIDGKTVPAPGKNCTVTITVDQPPKEPLAKCDRLTAQAILSKDRTYTYKLIYTAEAGAKLSKVTYNFGDGSSKTYKEKDGLNVEHTYAKPGKYTTTTTLHFTISTEGKTTEKSSTCTVAINIPKPENCPLPGKEDLPKNSPDCVEPLVETPPELPKTGLGEWFAGGVGFAALTAAFYYWKVSERTLRSSKLLKK